VHLSKVYKAFFIVKGDWNMFDTLCFIYGITVSLVGKKVMVLLYYEIITLK